MTGKTWDVAEVYAAARERLRLSRQPCEVCQGSGEYWVPFDDGHGGGFPHPDRCPACNGSGGVWPAELVRILTNAREECNLEDSEARAVLDAVESYLIGAGKGSE